MVIEARRRLWLLVLLGALLLVQGCREDEQDLILLHEPGVYQGEPDPGLSQEQVDELRGRARRQQF